MTSIRKIAWVDFSALNEENPLPDNVTIPIEKLINEIPHSIEFKKFSEDDISTARVQGFEEGKKLVESEYYSQAKALDIKMISLVDIIITKLDALEKKLTNERQLLSVDLANLAYSFASKMNSFIVNVFPKEILVDFLSVRLPTLFSENIIKIKLNPEDHESISRYLSKIPNNNNYVIMEDENVQIADCILEWENGKIVKDSSILIAQLEELLKEHINLEQNEKLNHNDSE